MHRLYHLTSNDKIKSILKNGLIPQSGHLSTLCEEKEHNVYLTNAKDAPKWANILDKWFVIRIDFPDDEIYKRHVKNNFIMYPVTLKLWLDMLCDIRPTTYKY